MSQPFFNEPLELKLVLFSVTLPLVLYKHGGIFTFQIYLVVVAFILQLYLGRLIIFAYLLDVLTRFIYYVNIALSFTLSHVESFLFLTAFILNGLGPILYSGIS